MWGSMTTWIFSLLKITFLVVRGVTNRCVKGALIELSKVGGVGFPAATMANSLQLLARWKLLTFNDVDGGGCDYRGGESDDDCEGAEKGWEGMGQGASSSSLYNSTVSVAPFTFSNSSFMIFLFSLARLLSEEPYCPLKVRLPLLSHPSRWQHPPIHFSIHPNILSPGS